MSVQKVFVMVCDRCGDSDNLMGEATESQLVAEMTRQGWTKAKEGDICPDCEAMSDEDDDDEGDDDEESDGDDQ